MCLNVEPILINEPTRNEVRGSPSFEASRVPILGALGLADSYHWSSSKTSPGVAVGPGNAQVATPSFGEHLHGLILMPEGIIFSGFANY